MPTAPEKSSIEFYEKRMRRLVIVAMAAIGCAGLGYILDQTVSADLSWLWQIPAFIGGIAGVGAMMCAGNKTRLEGEKRDPVRPNKRRRR